MSRKNDKKELLANRILSPSIVSGQYGEKVLQSIDKGKFKEEK